MNFRQRVAWLLLACYLACSAAALYYLFELRNWYNGYAVERIGETRRDDESRTWHLASMPPKLWMGALGIAYLQIFFLLLACTKAAPRCSVSLFWPLFLYVQCRSGYLALTEPSRKFFGCPVGYGHTVIDT